MGWNYNKLSSSHLLVFHWSLMLMRSKDVVELVKLGLLTINNPWDDLIAAFYMIMSTKQTESAEY